MQVYVTRRDRIAQKKRKPALSAIASGECGLDQFHDTIYNKSGTTYTSKMEASDITTLPYGQRGMYVHFMYHDKHFVHTYNESNYRSFQIPKHSGGFRTINEPEGWLKKTQKNTMRQLTKMMNGSHHTSAYAFIRHRNILDAVKKHQGNNSKWFLKLDLTDFFGSTTIDFSANMLLKIHPFEYCFKNLEEAKNCINVFFLNGTLPQGAPSSPAFTNLIMIPIDHEITCQMRKMGLVYTRYADDMLISGKQTIDVASVIDSIEKIFEYFDAPYKFNARKIRYGSIAGRNFNLGLMLNKDNNITIGHEKKKLFKARLTAIAMDYKSGERKLDVAYMNQTIGLLSFYEMVEKDYMEYLIDKYSKKYRCNLIAVMKGQA